MSYELILEPPPKEKTLESALERAAKVIQDASAIIFTSGAGMSVDSGMPDFRSKHGFWKEYPVYEEQKLDFCDIAQPTWFDKDPHLAWGFYGHRLNMYRKGKPHIGYNFLRKLSLSKDYFVVTSNVDGFFQKAGFDTERIWEIHGSIHHFQHHNGLEYYKDGKWHTTPIIPGDKYRIEVDPKTCRALGELPRDECGTLLRPNVLMFVDFGWHPEREAWQQENFHVWKAEVDLSKLVVIEVGAGMTIPTIRCIGTHLLEVYGGNLIRINPDEHRTLSGIGIPLSAKDALGRLGSLMGIL